MSEQSTNTKETQAEALTDVPNGVTEGGSFIDSAKMVLTVTLVAAISAGLLGTVYSAVKPRIEASLKQEMVDAFGYILPEHDNQPLDTFRCLKPVEATERKDCERGLYMAAKGDAPVGYAIETSTTAGFGPNIALLVGATPDGTVTGVYILSHTETPGLGAKMTIGQTDWSDWRAECAKKDGGCTGNTPFLRQFANRKLGVYNFKVTKDGGQVDSITASTITSRAVGDCIIEALELITANGGKDAGKGGAQ